MSKILEFIKNTSLNGHHCLYTMDKEIYPISLYSIGSLDRQEPINRRFAPNNTFLLCLSGEGYLSINNKVYTLKEGTGFIITRGTAINYYETKPVFKTMWIAMRGDIIKDILTYKNVFFQCIDPNELAEKWYKIYKLSYSSDWAMETSTHIYNFLLELNRQLSFYFEKNKQDLLFHQIITYFSYNLSEPYSLETLAKLVNISPGHICRLFKAKYGLTPNAYFENLKIEHAKELLENTNEKISEIATKCGYIDPNYFSCVFKKNTGVSPYQFKKQHFMNKI